jgi:hypothetical protein
MHTMPLSWRNTLILFVVLACGYAQAGWAAWLDEGQVPGNLALVYVIQDDTGSIGDMPVYIDGKYIEALQANSYLKLAVVPGSHEISTMAAGGTRTPLTATAGSRYYLKLRVTDGMPQLSVLPDAEGQELLARNRALRDQVFVSDIPVVGVGNPGSGVTDRDLHGDGTARPGRDMSRLSPGINIAIARASHQVSFGYGKLHQDYREFNDGLVATLPGILDSETGSVNGYRLAYVGMFSRLYVQLHLDYAKGDTDYVGYLQSLPGPVYTPFNTTTRNTFFDLVERVGYTIKAGNSAVVIPYAELQEYYWSRKIGVTTIYFSGAEEYSHLGLGVGAKLLFSPVTRLVFEIGAGGGYAVLGEMTTNGYRYTLGEKSYLSGYASADYNLVGDWHLKASADYRKWQYGQSDIVANAIEPHSQSVQTRYLLSMGYSF